MVRMIASFVRVPRAATTPPAGEQRDEVAAFHVDIVSPLIASLASASPGLSLRIRDRKLPRPLVGERSLQGLRSG